MLNYEYPPLGGGAGNANKQILQALGDDPGLEFDLICSSTDGFSIETPRPGQRIHFLDIGKGGSIHYQSNRDLLVYAWRAYWYARRLMKTQHYDLCHAFFGIPCGVMAWRLGLPYIVSLRGSDVPFYSARFRVLDTLIFQRLSRRVWAKAGAVVANSSGLRDLALASAPRQAIDVIPNGVDTEKFAPGEIPPGALRLLIVARLIARKRINDLIDAVGLLGDGEVTLSIVGDGKGGDELKTQVDAKDLSDRVHFLGPVDHAQLPDVYRDHHVFVLPSLNEGMSNTVLEAMASGLPIVMTDIGGAQETLEAGRNGYLIEAYSPESIAEALRHYVDDPGLIAVHGACSRRKAESMSWAAVAAAYRACYTAVGASS